MADWLRALATLATGYTSGELANREQQRQASELAIRQALAERGMGLQEKAGALQERALTSEDANRQAMLQLARQQDTRAQTESAFNLAAPARAEAAMGKFIGNFLPAPSLEAAGPANLGPGQPGGGMEPVQALGEAVRRRDPAVQGLQVGVGPGGMTLQATTPTAQETATTKHIETQTQVAEQEMGFKEAEHPVTMQLLNGQVTLQKLGIRAASLANEIATMNRALQKATQPADIAAKNAQAKFTTDTIGYQMGQGPPGFEKTPAGKLIQAQLDALLATVEHTQAQTGLTGAQTEQTKVETTLAPAKQATYAQSVNQAGQSTQTGIKREARLGAAKAGKPTAAKPPGRADVGATMAVVRGFLNRARSLHAASKPEELASYSVGRFDDIIRALDGISDRLDEKEYQTLRTLLIAERQRLYYTQAGAGIHGGKTNQ